MSEQAQVARENQELTVSDILDDESFYVKSSTVFRKGDFAFVCSYAKLYKNPHADVSARGMSLIAKTEGKLFVVTPSGYLVPEANWAASQSIPLDGLTFN